MFCELRLEGFSEARTALLRTVALAEARSRIMATLQEDAPRVVAGAMAEVDSTLVRLTEVRPGERDASARDLRPVLDLAVTRAAAGEPELLVNLARFAEDNAARRVVERAAVALVGALGGTDNYQTRNAWDAVQEELAAARGPEELAALDARGELDDLAAYVASSTTLVSLDLSLLDPSITGERRDTLSVQRAMIAAQVNEFESKHASGVPA